MAKDIFLFSVWRGETSWPAPGARARLQDDPHRQSFNPAPSIGRPRSLKQICSHILAFGRELS